jgi:N4-gp56 family major capsid protein
MTTTNTSTSNFSKFVQELIRKELEDELRPTLPHLDPALGAVKAKFVRGSNNTMRFLRIPDIDNDGNLTNAGTIAAGTQPWLTEGVAPSAEALAFGYEEFSAGQAGRRVELTDLSMDENPLDLVGVASERVAYNAKATIDEFVARKIAAGTNVMYAGSGNAARTDLTATDVVDGRLLRRAKQTMLGDSIPLFGDGNYHAVIHPDVVFDLEDDSDIGGWLDADRYSGAVKIMSGEVGKYAGIRFVQSSSARSFAAGAGDGSDVYSTVILGPGAFAVGDWGTVTTHVVMPGGHGDELAQVMSIGWKGRFGAMVVGEGANASSASAPRYLRIESASGI